MLEYYVISLNDYPILVVDSEEKAHRLCTRLTDTTARIANKIETDRTPFRYFHYKSCPIGEDGVAIDKIIANCFPGWDKDYLTFLAEDHSDYEELLRSRGVNEND